MNTIDPPLKETYDALFLASPVKTGNEQISVAGEFELPSVNMKAATEKEIIKAATSFGVFQIVNHEVRFAGLLPGVREAFHVPFQQKTIFGQCYRWGNPAATTISKFQWTETFHIPVSDISSTDNIDRGFRSKVESFAKSSYKLSTFLAEILARNVRANPSFFERNCDSKSSYVRLNRFPPCPISRHIYGLLPHTDSDFLTILHHDPVCGLQVLKDGRWLGVRSDPRAVVVILGDLFQAVSNNMYKSVKHRVVTNCEVERLSIA